MTNEMEGCGRKVCQDISKERILNRSTGLSRVAYEIDANNFITNFIKLYHSKISSPIRIVLSDSFKVNVVKGTFANYIKSQVIRKHSL